VILLLVANNAHRPSCNDFHHCKGAAVEQTSSSRSMSSSALGTMEITTTSAAIDIAHALPVVVIGTVRKFRRVGGKGK